VLQNAGGEFQTIMAQTKSGGKVGVCDADGNY
jgi:hypothetical protein